MVTDGYINKDVRIKNNNGNKINNLFGDYEEVSFDSKMNKNTPQVHVIDTEQDFPKNKNNQQMYFSFQANQIDQVHVREQVANETAESKEYEKSVTSNHLSLKDEEGGEDDEGEVIVETKSPN